MYTMRKTPRSSFMSMGDVTATATMPLIQPTVAITPTISPPFVAPTTASVPATDPTVSSPNYGMYVLAGGAALVAYWLLFRRKG